MTIPHAHLAVAAACAAMFAAVLAVVVPIGHPIPIDVEIATWMAAHRTPALTSLFTAISTLGSVVGIVPLGLAIAFVLHRRHGWRAARWLVIVVVGATAVYLAFNVPLGRPRPPLGLRVYPDDEWSFPSGHSTQSMAFWLAAVTLLAAGASRRVRIAGYGAALVVIGATGLSRIYLCAHWTTDVLGGFALGACFVALVFAVRRVWESQTAIDP